MKYLSPSCRFWRYKCWTVVYLVRTTDTMTRSLTPPTSLAHTHPSSMAFVPNDPIWWSYIDSQLLYSYWMVAAGVVVVYDWVLTTGQEIELIWRQRWSLMTVLYLVIRYIGTPYSVFNVLDSMPFVPLTDAVTNWTNVVMAAMLGAIMIARLHAMFQGSRTMLIFLVIIFLSVNISCVVLAAIGVEYIVPEELILSGMHMCGYGYEGDVKLLISMVWMLNTVWKVLALCLSVWIAVKHYRGLRRLGRLTGSINGDCFRVLIQSHVLYFLSFASVSCFQFLHLSPAILNSTSIGVLTLDGTLNGLSVVQMFVLGPRLILSVREYHAKLVTSSNADISMNSIVFQERVHISTSGTV
ncbi:hypothetical protein CY34DRAFT_639808 [Suillus luteus UH-Slu-Lm8-n1]|uniref:DUF6533 domain-containing protein n=1 Tax=Suillus luteus UH-Slu-Lm8-n1 TaxID=930992 RepID=A0A0C9ZAG6_9AGAM|nr:hypothetical protein CY34DRAFT_639808 [Suillus luteus UH-Slu-Lm8-n1]